MKKAALLALSLAACGLLPARAMGAQFVIGSDGHATLVGVISPSVQNLLVSYPNGGPDLADAVARLLLNNPDLADDVVATANASQNPAQTSAIARGFALALNSLRQARGGGEYTLQYAQQFFTPDLRATVALLEAQFFAATRTGGEGGRLPAAFIGGVGGFGAGGGGVASRN